ncbi:sensor histidine kinase [Natronomonas sp.]|uniref:sensor histidine kinase n=1 Tax=Natronomonas sp. TaxID=2184060 RepID=UPI002608DA77|nr:HAMP domain-containing sensor histidine kinase [Natronomonas sp.]
MSEGDGPHDVLLAVDERGTLTGRNRETADSLRGDGEGETDRSDGTTLIAPEDRETFASAVDQARETGVAGPFEITLTTAESPVVREVIARRLDTPEGDVVRVTLADGDCEHSPPNRDAEPAPFVSALVHDLRSPLSTIEGRLELARETGDMTHLDPIGGELDRIRRLIDDVLALARGGERSDGTHEVSLAGLVRDDAWTEFNGGSASLETGDLPTVTGDYDSLRRLFENLFRNAVEYGGEGVRITVGPLEDGAGFFVADDGPGIPRSERERVFERGYSGGSGTGLGLAIVQQAAREHGWGVAVTDGEDGGARFEFRFG